MRKRGFTLIELLIVIAVISILIGIALPRFRGMQDEGNIAKAKGELRTLQVAIESYYIHNNNTYPPTGSASLETELETAIPSIIDHVPADPFNAAGNDYVYILGGTGNQSYVVYSVGPEGNGSAAISTGGDTGDFIDESNGASCIYFSNVDTDAQP
jgi:general secretion pathway protein G